MTKIEKEKITFSDNSFQTSVGVSVGTILMYAGSNMDDISGNFELCNGDALDAVTNPQYNDLWNIIGTTYGGTSKSNFKVPNYQKKFPRGADTTTSRENGGGTDTIGDEHFSHNHTMTIDVKNPGESKVSYYTGAVIGNYRIRGGYYNTASKTTSKTLGNDNINPISETSKKYFPPYCAINYIICYKQ